MNMEPIASRFAAFGWRTRDIDGNDMAEIVDALDGLPLERGRPTAIVAHTVKGKGLGFAEGDVECHYWKPKEDELASAERELDEGISRREVLL
jgi:transketolase